MEQQLTFLFSDPPQGEPLEKEKDDDENEKKKEESPLERDEPHQDPKN